MVKAEGPKKTAVAATAAESKKVPAKKATVAKKVIAPETATTVALATEVVTKEEVAHIEKSAKPEKEEDCLLFKATATHGNTIKVLFDLLQPFLKRIIIRFTTSGLYISQNNEEEGLKTGSILCDVAFERSKFKSYMCKKNFTYSVTANHAQKLSKQIKMKNHVEIYVIKPTNGSAEIRFNIIPEKGADVQGLNITAHEETDPRSIGVPVKIVSPESYHFPIGITPQSLQKIKKTASDAKKQKKVSIYIQTDRYLAVNGPPNIYSTDYKTGSRVTKVDQILLPEGAEEILGDELITSTDEEYEDSPLIKETDRNFDIEKYPYMSMAEYNSEYITNLCKLSSFAKHVINIYQPLLPNYPLKISTSCELGECTIYIKTLDQIEYEISRTAAAK